MPIVSKNRIILQSSAKDKADAVRKAGEMLVKTGCVLPEYVDGMLTRERTRSTSLSNGIAIPHGMYENLAHILRAGISVLQLTNGVDWDDGEKVYLVIGIAAASYEHEAVLSKLSDVIINKKKLAELLHTTDPDVIIKYLGAN